MIKLSPSILSSDFNKLGKEIELIDKAGADYIHIDIMDGNYVPNISFGAPIIKCIRKMTEKVFDVHLMIDEPERYIEDFVNVGTDILTVHSESTKHLHRTIQTIKEYNIKAGVAINPGTPIEDIEWILGDVDMVLIMTVNPGFGGQSFIESMLPKIQKLADIKSDRKLNFEIEVDGGVNIENVKTIVNHGAEVIVAGSAIFGSSDVTREIKKFKSI